MASTLHAYMEDKCFCPLDKHLVDTIVAVNETSLSKRLASIALRLGGLDKKDMYYNYLLLPFILHDIGKAIELYQKNILGYSYVYHEVFGALLVHRIAEKVFDEMLVNGLIESEDYSRLIPLIIYPILHHHYSIRSPEELPKDRRFMEIAEKKKHLFIEASTLEKLLRTLSSEASRYGDTGYAGVNKWILPDILEDLASEARNLGSRIEFTSILKDLREMYEVVNGILNNLGHERETVEIHLSSLTGLINIADYLVASIERRPCNGRQGGFVNYILSATEISVLERKFINESSICIKK